MCCSALQSEKNLPITIGTDRDKAREWKMGTGLCTDSLELLGEEMMPLSSECCKVFLTA